MSNNVFDKTDVTLLGAGCASLSLASRASELEDYDFTVIDPLIWARKQFNLHTIKSQNICIESM